MITNQHLHIPKDYLLGTSLTVTPHKKIITVSASSKTGGFVSFDLTKDRAVYLKKQLEDHIKTYEKHKSEKTNH